MVTFIYPYMTCKICGLERSINPNSATIGVCYQCEQIENQAYEAQLKDAEES